MTDVWTLVYASLLLAGGALAQGWDLVERDFAQPPSGAGILKIIHNFPKDAAQREAMLASLADQGFGGIVCNVHFDDYMRSEENWEGFLHGVGLARGRGMRLWLYDEKGYPSGGAGGLTLEAYPEGRAEGLYIARVRASGARVEALAPPGEVVYAVACPVSRNGPSLEGSINLTGLLAGETLAWTPPDGEWEVFIFSRAELYEGTHATANVFMKQPYINLLDPEATRTYLKVNHDQYAARIPNLGEVFESTFTDEPSLMALFFARQPYPAVPWWGGFAASFREAKGYDLIPFLPALVAEMGDGGHRARCDYWDHVGELVAKGFFGQIADWCAQHGVPSGGHLLMEENLDQHVINYGDFYRCAELLDYPGIDCLTSIPEQVPWHIAKLLGSIAHLKSAPVVMSETSDHVQRYRPEGDTRPVVQVTADQIRGTCGVQFVAGVTTITSYYSFAGLSDDDLRQLNDWVGRCEGLLRGTESAADIGVLYPIESAWAAFTPANQGATSSQRVREIDEAWRRVQASLFTSQRDFEVVDSRAIAGGEVDDAVLHCGGLQLRTVVLPLTTTIRPEALERLAELAETGGLVVFAGAAPTDSLTRTADPRCSAALARLLGHELSLVASSPGGCVAQAMPAGGGCIYVGADLLPLLPRLWDNAIPRDVTVSEGLEALRVTHRRKAGRELYFVVNSSPEPIAGTITVAAQGPAQLMVPESGAIEAISREAEPVSIELSLPGYGARAIAADVAQKLDPPKAIDAPLALITEAWNEVVGPQVISGPGCAPHVTVSAAEEMVAGAVATLVHASLGESNVDSWCFAGVPVPVGALKGWAGLRVPIYVPADQGGPSPRFYLIAETEKGARYIAPLNRAVSEPGWSAELVWWSELDPMGGSEGAGPLDPAEITSLSVGWGGYFGAKGEEIQFGLGSLELVRFEE